MAIGRMLIIQHIFVSTGFEAVIGYLYLKGEKERLDELIEMIFSIVESGE